ncbi:unnamed protein product [Dovyalis caffra]|uniref:Uncharacterized protein n=1 Tax=Dovyalis caffra TaxID=77055 RepID=A0AAV1SKX6_9ROSI|nr:unnamed protein product [Dovyalis caffra]
MDHTTTQPLNFSLNPHRPSFSSPSKPHLPRQFLIHVNGSNPVAIYGMATYNCKIFKVGGHPLFWHQLELRTRLDEQMANGFEVLKPLVIQRFQIFHVLDFKTQALDMRRSSVGKEGEALKPLVA